MLETVAVDPSQALGLKKLKSKIKIDVNLIFLSAKNVLISSVVSLDDIIG